MSIKNLIISAIKTSKRPLENHEIRSIVQFQRRGTSPATIDTVLSQSAKNGIIIKTPVSGRGMSKNLYSLPTPPKLSAVIRSALKNSKQDSMQLFMVARSVIDGLTKESVDQTLYNMQLAVKNPIKKSKNPMTDTNSISSQSKFLYSL